MTHHLWRVIQERGSRQEQGHGPVSIKPARRRMLDASTPSLSKEDLIEQGAAKLVGRELKEDAEAELQSESATLGEAFARMLGKDALSKLARYESTLERSLLRMMHELERLQAARKGNPVMPPIAVDVTGLES
jgi:selenocysteine lyase/cysteine desulfurase